MSSAGKAFVVLVNFSLEKPKIEASKGGTVLFSGETRPKDFFEGRPLSRQVLDAQ